MGSHPRVFSFWGGFCPVSELFPHLFSPTSKASPGGLFSNRSQAHPEARSEEVGTCCAGDIDQPGGVFRLVVMRVSLTGAQHFIDRPSGSVCAQRESLVPMNSSAPNSSPGKPSTVGGSEFLKASAEVQQNYTKAPLTGAFKNPAGTSTATGGGSATQKSESDCHDCKPAVQSCGCYIGVCDDHFDELHLIRSVVDILFDWVLTLQKRQDRAKLKAESQSRPWTPGNRERTNGR